MSERVRIAYHEAGHALIARSLGRALESVSLSFAGGLVRQEPLAENATDDEIERALVVVFAGPEAERYAPETPRDTEAQPLLRDQIGIQLLGRLGLRRNELRLLKVSDFDLGRGTVLVHGKGGKVSVMPLGFPVLKRDLEVHLIGKDAGEYLLYPKADHARPMTAASVHRWFKTCLERAGMPTTMKMHELRHSAADNLWRATGDLVLAQKLLRHESVSTTQGYLHPSHDDLETALEQPLRSGEGDSA